jgi:hypothetical protein
MVVRWIMKNIVEVLKQKEAELQQLQTEIDALRVALRLVTEDGDNLGPMLAATGTIPEPRVKEINKGTVVTRQFP